MPADDAEIFDPPEVVAKELGVTEKWLAKRRMTTLGPPFVRFGKFVRYPRSARQAWIAQRMRETGCDVAA